MREQDILKLKTGSDAIRIYDTLSEWPELRDAWKGSKTGLELIGKIEGTAAAILLDNLNFTEDDLGSVLRSLRDTSVLNNNQKTGAAKTALKGLTLQLGDPKGNPEKFRNLARKVYSGQDIYQFLKEEDHVKVFTELTNPKITNRILETKDRGLIQQYYNWSVSQLHTISDFRTMAGDVNTISNTRDFLEAQVNEKGQIQVTVDTEAFDRFSANATDSSRREMVRSMKNTIDYIGKFNSVSSALVPIMEGTGRDPQEQMTQIIGNLGVDLDSRSDSWLQWLADKAVTPREDLGEGDTETEAKVLLQDYLSTRPEWLKVTEPDRPPTIHK
jgi:hypothetical protein